MGKTVKKALSLLLALMMVLGMLPMSVFAAEIPTHTHNEGGWVCTQAEGEKKLDCQHEHTQECYAPGEPVLICEENHHTEDCYALGEDVLVCEIVEHEHTEDCYAPGESVLTCGTNHHTEECYAAGEDVLICVDENGEHKHTDKCYVTTEGEWTCVNAVQNFLNAVKVIPAEINADNAEEAGELVNAAFDAYEVLVDAGLDGYDGVADALAKVEAAYVAIDEALEMGSSTFSGYWHDGDSLAGFGAAIGYDPKDASKFPATDGTYISVIPWDFHNSDHAKDYYYYIDYRLGLGEGNTHPRTEPAPDPVQSSYFEKTYHWVNDYGYYYDWYTPLEFSKTAAAGATGSLSWRQGVTNFNDSAGGLVPTIPSVYLYRLEEVTGTEYITGGRDGITFKANDEVKLESSGGPVYRPTGPYIQCDVPVSESAPKGAKIQVRFRLAMGYEMEWQTSEGTYDWYVQDFILNLTVGESGGSTVDPDITAYHDLYIPAGYSTTMALSKAGNYYHTKPYTLTKGSYEVEDTGIADVTDISLGDETTNLGGIKRNVYNNVTIKAADDADDGDTTTISVTYTGTYSGTKKTFLDIITVHIVAPQSVSLNTTDKKTETVQPQQGTGTLSSSDIVFRFVNTDGCVKAQRYSSEKVMLTAIKDGSATLEHHYHYYDDKSGKGVYYDELDWYVDVINVTVGDPKGDDPDTIDGLDIKKEVDKTTAVGGDTLTYTITVTNDSSVDKKVTVTDELPYGTTFVSSEPSTGVTHSNGKVTWTTTVPKKDGNVKGSATLTITVTVDDDARGNLNNKATLKSENGGTKDSLTVTTAVTPKPTTYTVRWMGVDEDQDTPTTENLPWVQLHSEQNVTADSEPTWATVKGSNNLTDPKDYTLNGKTYTWKGTWREEWNADKTVKTYWAEYEVKGGGTGSDTPDPEDFNITVTKTITAVNGKSYTAGTIVNDGDKVTYQVVVTNNTAKDLTLHDLVIWDVMDKGLTMTGNPTGTVVGNDGNTNNVVYKGSAAYVENGVTTDKTAYYWQLAGTFKKGASVTLTYTDTVSHDSHDEATLHNVAYALGYTVEAETQQNQKSRRAAFDPSDLFDPDRENQKVEGSSGTGVAGGGSGQQITVGGKPYTVTFDPNGGNWDNDINNKTVNVKKGETVGNQMPADPAQDQYEFTGWNTQADGKGTAFNKDTPITGDVTVYAQWTPKAATLDNLTITKTVDGSKTEFNAGESVTYNIRVANSANKDVTVTVTDVLPAGLEFRNANSEVQDNSSKYVHVDVTESNGAVTWNNVTIPANGWLDLKVMAKVVQHGSIVNTATVKLGEQSKTSDPVTVTGKGILSGFTKIALHEGHSLLAAAKAAIPDFDSLGVTVPAGVNSDEFAEVRLSDFTNDQIKLLFVLCVSGYPGTPYSVVDTGADRVGGAQMNGMLPFETNDKGMAHAYIYVTKTFSKTDAADGYLYNEATVTPGVNGTTSFTADDSVAVKMPSVTVNYVTDGETPVSLGSIKYYPAEGTEYNHSVGNGTTVPTVGNKDTKSPASITVGDNTYAYDKVLTDETTLTGTMGSADVTITVVYSLDVKGGNDSNKPEGGPDGTPDKYQAKVVYTAGAGGTITSATKSEYLTIKDASGNMATTGTISITGATAAPTGNNRFVNWTAAATKDNDWTYTPSTDATLAGFNISDAKGGAEYTFTANFQANPGTPLEVKADDVTDTYDGEPHPVVPTTNKDGVTVTVVYKDAQGNEITGVPVDAGEYTAEITATLGSESKTINVTVTINKRGYSVITASDSKVYDGTPLTNANATVTVEGGEVDGESITATANGTQTEVGSSNNTYTMNWGTAKESNYELRSETIGTLTVTAPVIVIPDPVDTTYTLNYNANGGEGAPASQSQLNSNVFTVSGGEPTREGYTFQGWATTPDGAVSYQAGSSITITGLSQTLYAVWQQDEEDITDENPPLTELPDTGEENPDADLPKDPTEELPDEEDISDEDVPLTDVPKTGDHTNRFLVMAAVSGLCLLTLLSGRKKEDEA